MSAVKRVFTHSAIRSAIRKPFVPNDDGYREYMQRSVPEFDGTQYGIFTSKINLSQGCKISFSMATTSDLIHVLMSFVTDNDTGEYFRIGVNWQDNDGYLKIETAGHTPGIGTILVTDGKLHKIDIDIPIDGSIKVYVDGVLDYTTQHTNLSLLNRDFDVYLSQGRSHNAAIPYGEFIGVLSDLSIVDSDGLPIPGFGDIQLDERDTDYQRDRAVALGVEEFTPSRVGGNFVDNGDGSYTKSTEGGGDLGEYYTENPISGTYLVEFTVSDTDGTINIFSRNATNSSNDTLLVGFGAGAHRVVVTTLDGGGVWLAKSSFTGTVSNISIREWSGAILQNFVHGDGGNWLDIERKRYWDYWLGVENLFIPTVVSATWDDNGDGSYTKNADNYGALGENYSQSELIGPGEWRVGYSMPAEFGNMRLYTRREDNAANISSGIPASSAGLVDIIVPLKGLWFDSNDSTGTTISNISFRRKLEIAQ